MLPGKSAVRQSFDQYCTITGKQCEIGCKLVLVTHRKSHTNISDFE